ncbi:uncharacterized protein M421DRAFT_156237 [Didymella exigua CBS 183.55]|uniref:Uncharacterized protein n=1 Tax=Didymella exigua CBS 183.55 TaxID=1150837 RepID=A0A6A5RPH7_9PLEO|nr:uncharacterized protein M421DRAFT_156237 [Didymella exigua CBS 183.55]KAF1928196.1 hypothetical protein M421DRAFT_156237 [Didymella exigua CBS 183.55]
MSHQPAMPRFIFCIEEARQHPGVDSVTDSGGHWLPSLRPGSNYKDRGQGVTNLWWICNGTQIYSIAEAALPADLKPYKTYSVFFSEGFGFRILQGDATNPPPGEVWHPLGFEHDDRDNYSSYLTNVVQSTALRCHRQDQAWPGMLLPNIFHGPVGTGSQGALKGELPIFLGLLALSMSPAELQVELPQMFHHGMWQTHTSTNRWQHKRGVVVTVFSYPTTAGGSVPIDIQRFEDGCTGKYYY